MMGFLVMLATTFWVFTHVKIVLIVIAASILNNKSALQSLETIKWCAFLFLVLYLNLIGYFVQIQFVTMVVKFVIPKSIASSATQQ